MESASLDLIESSDYNNPNKSHVVWMPSIADSSTTTSSIHHVAVAL
jgi:hypothetical protein